MRATQDAARRRDRRHRSARPAGAARRRHRSVRARGRRRARRPGDAIRRCAPRSSDETATDAGLAARVRAARRARPGRGGAHRAGQPAPHRARARGDRAHRPPVLVVRARPRRVRPARARRRAGRHLAADAPSSARRIAARFAAMRAAGLVDEVRALAARPGGLSRTARQAIGYQEVLASPRGRGPRSTTRSTRPCGGPASFARRQRVWFRRDPRITLAAGRRKSSTARGRGSGTLGARPTPPSRRRVMNDCSSPSCTPPATTSSCGSRSTASRSRSTPRVVAALCDRHRGIGADGLITIGPGASGADCTMTLQNADGGDAEMSGNGVRCLAWVAARAGLGTRRRARRRHRRRPAHDRARRATTHGEVVAAEVDMGPVTFGDERRRASPSTAPSTAATSRASATRTSSASSTIRRRSASRRTVRSSSATTSFPQRTNVEFVRGRRAPTRSTMRVWERGAGETLSCGTGACAAAAVAHRRGSRRRTACACACPAASSTSRSARPSGSAARSCTCSTSTSRSS